eukprot:1566921-Pyramimonas_sp.AAC.1
MALAKVALRALARASLLLALARAVFSTAASPPHRGEAAGVPLHGVSEDASSLDIFFGSITEWGPQAAR